MAKKKAAKKVAAKRTRAVAKKVTKTKSAKTSTKKAPAATKAGGNSKAAPAKPRVKRISLGRPKVTAEEKLYMLFKEDYHARQIFEFLRVETVRELEQYSPQEIVHRLSRPIRQTVDVIRRKLAAKNRSLAGDEEFAAKHKGETRPAE